MTTTRTDAMLPMSKQEPIPSLSAERPNWVLVPTGIVRMAGFAFQLLDPLADQSTAGSATGLVKTQQAAAAAPRGSERAELRRRANEFTKRFEADYAAAELRTSWYVLETFRADELLTDMLLISNDSAYPRFQSWLTQPGEPAEWRSKDRQYIDSLTAYLQRVCAKNDTTSHFGPFAFATVDARRSGVHWRLVDRQRMPVLSRWMGNALAGLIRADPLLLHEMTVRLRPTAFLGSSHTVQVLELDHTATTLDSGVHIGPPIELDQSDLRLLELVRGRSPTVDDLSAGRPDTDEPTVRSRLLRLEHHGVITIGPQLPYGITDPLTELAAQLPAGPAADRWRVTLTQLASHLDAMATGDAVQRRAALSVLKSDIAKVTELSSDHRGEGKFYSDRAVMHEECLGPVADLTMGTDIHAALSQQLQPVCELYMLRGRRRIRHERKMLAEWFAGRFGPDATIDVLSYVAAFVTDLPTLTEKYDRIDRLLTELNEAVQAILLPNGTSEHVAELSAGQLEAVFAGWSVDEPAVCNPDVMIAAASPAALADGSYRLIVGDLHADEENLTHGLFSPYLAQRFPDIPTHITHQYESLLGSGEQLADVTLSHRNKTFFRAPLDCVDVELVDPSPAGVRKLNFSDLLVSLRGDRLQLHARAAGGPALRLVTLPLAWTGIRCNPFSVFGFPRRDGLPILPGRDDLPHLPRLQHGRVVLQREHWRIDAAELVHRDRSTAFLRAQHVRIDAGLPRHVYVKSAEEPKPVYCDLDSPLLVRQLTRIARNTESALVVQEMMPAEDELWLDAGTGRLTSEIRCAMFTSGRREQ